MLDEASSCLSPSLSVGLKLQAHSGSLGKPCWDHPAYSNLHVSQGFPRMTSLTTYIIVREYPQQQSIIHMSYRTRNRDWVDVLLI